MAGEASSNYIVFVDESGDHSLESINPQWPLFVLSFCIFEVETYVREVTPAIRALKFDTFGHDLVILHERDIRKKLGPFSTLGQDARESFLSRLTEIIAATNVTIIAIVIHKLRHQERYVSPIHPYYLAMQFGLERVAKFLRLKGHRARATHVVFEGRGRTEDKELELAFRRSGMPARIKPTIRCRWRSWSPISEPIRRAFNWPT